MNPSSPRVLIARRLRRTGALLRLVATCLGVGQAVAHEGLHEQIDAVTRQIADSPTNAPLYLRRAELHRLHGEVVQAAADLDRAAHRDASLAGVDLTRGRLLADQKLFAKARAALDRYTARRADDPQGYIARARVLIQLGAPAPAAADFTRAIELSREPLPEYYLERAQAFAALDETDAALRGLDEGMARLGSLVTLQLFAVELERGRTNFPGALSRLEAIIAVSSRREKWLALRGDILLQAGRAKEAVAAYREADSAIGELPSRLRDSRAMADLKAHVADALKRFAAAPPPSQP